MIFVLFAKIKEISSAPHEMNKTEQKWIFDKKFEAVILKSILLIINISGDHYETSICNKFHHSPIVSRKMRLKKKQTEYLNQYWCMLQLKIRWIW